MNVLTEGDLVRHLKLSRTVSECVDWSESDRKFRFYLSESYGDPKKSWSLKKSIYYSLRPFLPRKIQILLRRVYSRVQRKAAFPHWPIEDTLELVANDAIRKAAEVSGRKKIPYISYWPNKYKWCLVLTHDVESAAGVANIKKVVEIEKGLGFRSSWNFVPERYLFDRKILDWLFQEGFEVGVHGLTHDGKLFSSHDVFESRLKRIHGYMRDWKAEGFRSPATHRRFEWMHELEFNYDSSFPDTDIFEPQAGGCCWYFPFFIDALLELPITLPQDHTLLEILGTNDLQAWYQKCHWLKRRNAMALLILHPDYVVDPERLKLYEKFLQEMSSDSTLWNPLPKELALWWRERDSSEIQESKGKYEIVGPVSRKGGKISYFEIDS